MFRIDVVNSLHYREVIAENVGGFSSREPLHLQPLHAKIDIHSSHEILFSIVWPLTLLKNMQEVNRFL